MEPGNGEGSSPTSKAFQDLVIIFLGSVCVFALSATFDVFNKVIGWIYKHDTWQLDECFMVAAYLVFALLVYVWRRHREMLALMRHHEVVEQERAHFILELETVSQEMRASHKLIPLCSSCGRLRDDEGGWNQMEEFLETHLNVRLDAGVCPECARKLYENRT